MWPFFKSKEQKRIERIKEKLEAQDLESQKRRMLTFEQLLDGMEQLDTLGTHDAVLKFWLPEPAAKALDELSKLQGFSMSAMLREFLAVHAYGLYPVQLLLLRNATIFRDISVMFSIKGTTVPPGKKRVDTYFVPELGKNVVPIKLWVANCLRDDLQDLADHVGIKLSQYIREIVISRLLGHGTLPKRPNMLASFPDASADAWCNGSDVAMRDGTAAEFLLYSDSRRETRLEDSD